MLNSVGERTPPCGTPVIVYLMASHYYLSIILILIISTQVIQE